MKKRPEFISAKNDLKGKVGDGGIPSHVLKTCQAYLESNPVDFIPYARIYLQDLNDLNKKISAGGMEPELAIKTLGNIVMQLKSNGSMFHYQLVSMTSDVMLKFLEKVVVLDKDFYDILHVYLKSIEIIINKKLKGNGGTEGYALTQELHNACLRYFSKTRTPV